MSRVSNRGINELIIKSLKSDTLIGTWVDLEDIPAALKEGKEVLLLAPTRASLVTRVEDLTLAMRMNKVPYRHILWIKGAGSATIAFKVLCIETGKACYCISEENLKIIKQIEVDKHCRIF